MTPQQEDAYLNTRRAAATLRLLEKDYDDNGSFESGAANAFEAIQAARCLLEEAIAAVERGR
jgi:hypothetical protein